MEIDSIVIMIKKASLEFEKMGNQLLIPYDITHPQFKTLKYLYKNPPRTVRQIDIEKQYSLTNPTVTGILQNLEKKGLIGRVANPEDSRSKVIVLTEKAYSMEADLNALGRTMESKLTARLSDDERKELLMLLKKMLSESKED